MNQETYFLCTYILYLSAVADVMVLILWGSEFGVRITNNVAIFDTILSSSKLDGLASLDYSYFLLIVAEFEHLMAIGLLYYRDRVLNRESKQKTIAVDSRADNNDLIY